MTEKSKTKSDNLKLRAASDLHRHQNIDTQNLPKRIECTFRQNRNQSSNTQKRNTNISTCYSSELSNHAFGFCAQQISVLLFVFSFSIRHINFFFVCYTSAGRLSNIQATWTIFRLKVNANKQIYSSLNVQICHFNHIQRFFSSRPA